METKRANFEKVSLGAALKVWAKISLLSFGGPAGQIAVMHRVLVEEKKWISEARFLHALNYCMLLPGPEAQQLATYIGWLMHRWTGGLIAGALFVLPGFISILFLSIVYVFYRDVGIVSAVLFGLKPAVLAIVVAAVLRIGKKTLRGPVLFLLAALSFFSLFFFSVPFPLVILVAALLGYVLGRLSPASMKATAAHGSGSNQPGENNSYFVELEEPTLIKTAGVLLVWGGLWLAPVAAMTLFFGRGHVFTEQGIFFSKTAAVTFGGAYAVLSYIGQQAVEHYHWLNPKEMIDGLGMAETTPGPLIQVVQFVGFLGAFRAAEAGLVQMSPLGAAVAASILTTWVTFMPSFLWIFVGAPYSEKLRGNKAVSNALTAITAAVVGVILNLAVWFGIHVIFKTVNEFGHGVLRIQIPELSSVDEKSLLLVVLALVLSFGLKLGMMKVLALTVAAGTALYFI